MDFHSLFYSAAINLSINLECALVHDHSRFLSVNMVMVQILGLF